MTIQNSIRRSWNLKAGLLKAVWIIALISAFSKTYSMCSCKLHPHHILRMYMSTWIFILFKHQLFNTFIDKFLEYTWPVNYDLIAISQYILMFKHTHTYIHRVTNTRVHRHLNVVNIRISTERNLRCKSTDRYTYKQ